MASQKQLPLGIQSLSKIRQRDYYYIDKTDLALALIEKGTHYLLSRPRRFGKSLFIDTLKELFEGNEPLFQGLAVHPHWDWSIKYPVLRFSFGSKHYSSETGVHDSIHSQLTQFEDSFGTERRFEDASSRFSDLILKIHKQVGQPVVVLIDEYDKPILDAINQPDLSS